MERRQGDREPPGRAAEGDVDERVAAAVPPVRQRLARKIVHGPPTQGARERGRIERRRKAGDVGRLAERRLEPIAVPCQHRHHGGGCGRFHLRLRDGDLRVGDPVPLGCDRDPHRRTAPARRGPAATRRRATPRPAASPPCRAGRSSSRSMRPAVAWREPVANRCRIPRRLVRRRLGAGVEPVAGLVHGRLERRRAHDRDLVTANRRNASRTGKSGLK